MSGPVVDVPHGGGRLTFAVLAVAVVAFGFVGGLPYLVGPAIGVVGVALSAVLRRRRAGTAPTLQAVPALAGLGILASSSPAVPSAELLGGLATLGVLLWLADDPSRPAGGGRRAIPALLSCGVAVGVAWSLALLLPTVPREVGVAGGLLATVLFVVALLLAREEQGRRPSDATA